jgi:hypothetical protein
MTGVEMASSPFSGEVAAKRPEGDCLYGRGVSHAMDGSGTLGQSPSVPAGAGTAPPKRGSESFSKAR